MPRVVDGMLVLLVLIVAPSSRAFAAEQAAESRRSPDCVYVGSPNDVVAKMLEMAQLRKGDFVCDPGCGDGRMVIAAARSAGCRGIGFEIDPRLAAEARQLAKKRKVDHLVTIEERDIFTVDYSKNTVVVMYLLPEMITRLLPQLEQLPLGARIVAHDYSIQGVEPDQQIDFKSNEDNVEHALFLYTLPLKKES